MDLFEFRDIVVLNQMCRDNKLSDFVVKQESQEIETSAIELEIA